MLEIPKISNEVLEERYARIKPLVKRDGKLYTITKPDLRNQSFIWDPKLEQEVSGGLKEVVKVKTLHTYGHYSLFKPSVAEVLAQIPDYLLDKVVAFHIDGPDSVTDLNKFGEETNMGFHVAFTTLYKGKAWYEGLFHKSV